MYVVYIHVHVQCIYIVGNELDEDVREALTEQEEELRAYLLHGEALSEETMDIFTTQFWDTEPYKYITSTFMLLYTHVHYMCIHIYMYTHVHTMCSVSG